MRLTLVRRLALAVCLLALCSCARRDSEEVARLTKELEAAKAEAAAAKAELALLKSPKQGDSVSGAGEKSSDNKKGGSPKAEEPEAKGPDKGGVYRSPSALFADMPKDAYPKSGEEFGIERKRCRDWCRANLPGRTVELTATVNEKVEVSGDGPLLVRIVPDGLTIASGSVNYGCLYFGEPISCGDQKWQVVFFGATGYGGKVFGFEYHCTEAEADQLRKLKGKKVNFRITVIEDPHGGEKVEDRDGDGKPVRWIYVRAAGPPSINGFLPEADRPGAKK